MVWGKWSWLQNLYLGIDQNSSFINNTEFMQDADELMGIIALEEELNDFQPIYRNPLLQKLYKTQSTDCMAMQTENLYNFISIKHGAWIPSEQYLKEAVDFSWADFQSIEETEDQELEISLNAEDMDKDAQKHMEELKKQIESDREKRKKEEQKLKEFKEKQEKKQNLKRRLLSSNNHPIPPFLKPPNKKGNPLFDPLRALPNPANIIKPHSPGDEGQGDAYEQQQRNTPNFGDLLPKWLEASKKKGFQGLGPRDMAKDIVNRLPFVQQQHVKHLDQVNRQHHGEGVLNAPKDILKQIDLTKFGISEPVDASTSDQEKETDLEILEEEEAYRHPYMTLLTNPGQMDDVKCIENDYRKHQVEFKVFDKHSANEKVDGILREESPLKSSFSYDNDVLMWYCYLVEVEDDVIGHFHGGQFRVNLTFSAVDLEIGFDYVQIYINSQLIDTVSGIGLNWDENNEKSPSFVYFLNDDYIITHGNALEVCMKIVTDSSVIKGGFMTDFSVDYDDPLVTKWSQWSKCETLPVENDKGDKNKKHWDGGCGVGVRTKKVEKCEDPSKFNETMDIDPAPCNLGEQISEYCVKKNCFDYPMTIDPKHPNSAFLFNGHGRVDPDYADPYTIQRSIRDDFDLTYMMEELEQVRAEIILRYPDERVLGAAMINHYYMDQSKLRLGIRLVRSLLLGDAFTVYTTGSSNTAGHENMFMSTWPMQFQSIMRPIWKRIGYKGAAFRVVNNAEGGGLGTMQIGPCISSLVGDDADVVYWESHMNDHGDSVAHSEENHFRNSITLPRRPMYHIMHAGKNGPTHAGKYDEQYDADELGHEKGFKNEKHCYSWVCGKNGDDHNFENGILMEPYTDYGSGLTMFYPANGLSSVNTSEYEEFSVPYLYVSWHPGPTGHRVYAEMLAYHYINAALETFADIKDLIQDLIPQSDGDDGSSNGMQPIEEMLEILEDPPTNKEIPHDNVAKQCDPFCTNATESVCISGYYTLGKPRFSLKRWRKKSDHSEDLGRWRYDTWMKNNQALIFKKGGQGNNDIKYNWKTAQKDSTEIKFVFEAKQYGYIAIECDDFMDQVNKDKEVEIIINEIDMQTGKIAKKPTSSFKEVGKPLQCIDARKVGKNWLLANNGCNIGGLQPYQKYELVINVVNNLPQNKQFFIKNIRVF